MNVTDYREVTLRGDLESARRALKALDTAWGALPDGEDRDEIMGLRVQLGYAIGDTETLIEALEN